MLNNGFIMPNPARPATSANAPSPITTIPADLKNRGACFECANDADPNESSTSIGSVPKANANIIENPDMNDPLESATTCIDCVKPQGRKNVPNPMISGVKVLCSILRKKLKTPECKVILFLAKTPTRFNPSINITIDAKIPSIAVNVKFIPMALPINPRTPPNTAKLNSLPA